MDTAIAKRGKSGVEGSRSFFGKKAFFYNLLSIFF